MSELCMGKTKSKSGKEEKNCLVFSDGQMYKHILVVGQSGCGKSTTLARLLEELILNSGSNVVLFDFNNDYSKFDEVNYPKVDKVKGTAELTEEEKKAFEEEKNDFIKKWQEKAKDFKFFECKGNVTDKRFPIAITLDKLSLDGLHEVFGLDPSLHPESTWFIDALDEESVDFKKEALQLVKKDPYLVPDWKSWKKPKGDALDNCTLVSLFSTFLEAHYAKFTEEDFKRISNSLSELNKFDIWNNDRSQKSKLENFFSEDGTPLNKLPNFTCINLASIKEVRAKLAVCRFLLEKLWKIRQNERLDAQQREGGQDERKPLFVVIDEAHNLIPQDPQEFSKAGVLSLIRRIAAEGRKDGLFLILCSQRPRKLNLDVVSECDNLCLMKLTARGDINWLYDSFGGITEEIKDKVSRLGKWEAIFIGDWNDEENSLTIKIDRRRTKETGGNLPKSSILQE